MYEYLIQLLCSGKSSRMESRRKQELGTTTGSSIYVFSRRIDFLPQQDTPEDDTIPNLRIGKDTRVIFQGFTGRQATRDAGESLAWGTKIVGGVKPDFEGEHSRLGLPVLPTVRRAMEELSPQASILYVPASHAARAIEEAIEAEVPLIVAVSEHIPLHDILRVRV